jgi:hypothetical protein
MRSTLFDITLFILASPVLFIRSLFRLVRWFKFYRMAYATYVTCRHCGAVVSLVNFWRCPCGYTAAVHLLRPCPGCGALPSLIRCQSCGATERLPEL